MSEELKREERAITNLLKELYIYKNKPLRFSHVKSEDFNAHHLGLKKGTKKVQEKIGDVKGVIDSLNKYKEKTDNNVTKNNIDELLKFTDEASKTLTGDFHREDVEARLYLSWAKEVGDLPLGRWSNRRAIYEYWSGVAEKYKDVEKAFEALKTEYNQNKPEGKLKELMDELFEESVPQYIIQIPAVPLDVPSHFGAAINILDYYNELRGVLTPEEEEELGVEYEEGVQHLTDSKRRRIAQTYENTQKPKGLTKIDVDPIFWYKYNSDYEGVNIPKNQVQDVKEVMKTSPLKYAALSDEELDDFDDWFDRFITEIGRDEQYDGQFFLPISSFMADLPKRTSLSSKQDEVNEEISDFIELVANIIEVDKTQFTTYQRQIFGAKGSVPHAYEKRTRQKREDFQEEGKGRTIPEGLVGPWTKFLESLNDYYLIPISSKFFIESKQRPRWAKSHASYLIAIKDAARNPVGSMLTRIMDESLNIVSTGEIEDYTIDDLTDFIKDMRRSGAKRWSRDYFDSAKKAVHSLDDLFGEQFHDKNMESIGYILYDMGKKMKIDEEDILEMATPFWKDLKKHYDGYKSNEVYPIDQLRYSLNTPEFTALIGISDERAEGDKKPREDVDIELVESLKRLDRLFDEFHKMDEINTAMLEAHDTIRKMNNEPILSANLSLDLIEDMDLIINKLHLEQNMEVTATEVNRIVKAVSSYESIAANFGINEESVYTIKALFR